MGLGGLVNERRWESVLRMQTKGHNNYDHKGRVYMELAQGDAAECERALAVLRASVDQSATAVAAIRKGA